MTSSVWRRSLGAIAFVLLTLALWAFWLEPASLTIREERISLGWSARQSIRVAVLTDLHVGSPFNGLAALHELVQSGRVPVSAGAFSRPTGGGDPDPGAG